jgi:hypothetical protein
MKTNSFLYLLLLLYILISFSLPFPFARMGLKKEIGSSDPCALRACTRSSKIEEERERKVLVQMAGGAIQERRAAKSMIQTLLEN